MIRRRRVGLADNLGMAMVLGEVENGYHVVWLSPLPIVHSENHRSPWLSKTLLQIDIQHAGEVISLFATHLGSRHDARKPVGESPLILDVMQRVGRLHLLVGDFNALCPDDPVGVPPPGVAKRGEAVDGTPRPALRPLLAAGYLDAYRALHPDVPGYTYLGSLVAAPWLRLDYVFLAPSLARPVGRLRRGRRPRSGAGVGPSPNLGDVGVAAPPPGSNVILSVLGDGCEARPPR